MTRERRNLYRILFLQPEAPPELVTAAYRCLMTQLRAHPLPEARDSAARVQQAYSILRDPAKRRAYDNSRRRPLSSKVPSPGAHKEVATTAPRVCPFCCLPVPRQIAADTRCSRCSSPLAPIAYNLTLTQETFGRRAAPRAQKNSRVTVHTAPEAPPLSAVLRDLSVTGVSLYTARLVTAGRNIRVEALGMDLVAHVLRVQPREETYLVRAFILTALYNRNSAAPMSVSAKDEVPAGRPIR